MFNIPQLLRAKRKAKVPLVVEFLPVQEVFKPQRYIRMLKDVSGWVNKDKLTGKKWHFNTGQEYYVDADVADEFIIKGYAKGDLSRKYSADEIAEIRAQVQNIALPQGGK